MTADVGRWAERIDRIQARLGPRSTRSEVRNRVGLYLHGLLAGVDRKNGWQLVEFAGDEPRREVAHIPTAVAFATKPTLARGMVERALDAGVPAA